MLKATNIIALAAPALILGACTASERTQPIELADDTSIRVTGPAQDCLRTNVIRSTDIVDDYTIDFDVGSKTYRNRLPYRCSGLRSADAFSYETSLSQLCDVNIIRVLRTMGGGLEPGISCGLGDFTPIEHVKG